MERIQHRALSFVFGNDYRKNRRDIKAYKCLLTKANVAPLTTSRLRAIALQVFKSIHQLGPSYLHNLFKPNLKRRSSRNKNSVDIPRVNTTTFGQHSLRFYGAKLWNELKL